MQVARRPPGLGTAPPDQISSPCPALSVPCCSSEFSSLPPLVPGSLPHSRPTITTEAKRRRQKRTSVFTPAWGGLRGSEMACLSYQRLVERYSYLPLMRSTSVNMGDFFLASNFANNAQQCNPTRCRGAKVWARRKGRKGPANKQSAWTPTRATLPGPG